MPCCSSSHMCFRAADTRRLSNLRIFRKNKYTSLDTRTTLPSREPCKRSFLPIRNCRMRVRTVRLRRCATATYRPISWQTAMETAIRSPATRLPAGAPGTAGWKSSSRPSSAEPAWKWTGTCGSSTLLSVPTAQTFVGKIGGTAASVFTRQHEHSLAAFPCSALSCTDRRAIMHRPTGLR